MNCPRCQSLLPEGAVYCPKCGMMSAPTPSPQTLSGQETIIRPLVQRGTTKLDQGALFANRYEVLAKLGEGGMGIVYAARDRTSSLELVLKLIHPDLVQGESAVRRLMSEGLTAREIRHPNVVAVYDVSQWEGQPYFTMEYVRGRSLRSWLVEQLNRSNDVPLAAAVGLIKGILAGLAEAHRMGIVHRDLKPENILLKGEPGHDGSQIKIVDFGIAKAVGTTRTSKTSFGGGGAGTPLYMAPEQMTSSEGIKPSADLYSLSVMLYEMLMDALPQNRFEPVSKYRKDVPAAIDELIEKGLSVRPRSRYQSAAEYAEALDRAIHAPQVPLVPQAPVVPPVPVVPPSPPPPPPPPTPTPVLTPEPREVRTTEPPPDSKVAPSIGTGARRFWKWAIAAGVFLGLVLLGTNEVTIPGELTRPFLGLLAIGLGVIWYRSAVQQTAVQPTGLSAIRGLVVGAVVGLVGALGTTEHALIAIAGFVPIALIPGTVALGIALPHLLYVLIDPNNVGYQYLGLGDGATTASILAVAAAAAGGAWYGAGVVSRWPAHRVRVALIAALVVTALTSILPLDLSNSGTSLDEGLVPAMLGTTVLGAFSAVGFPMHVPRRLFFDLLGIDPVFGYATGATVLALALAAAGARYASKHRYVLYPAIGLAVGSLIGVFIAGALVRTFGISDQFFRLLTLLVALAGVVALWRRRPGPED